uniref:Mitochondrial ribosomal protein S24 n=1 Tax=Equus asinus TaxID=9793 RepID=A0A9L0I960_EQUAS
RLTFTLGAPRPAPSPARRRGTLRALRSAQDGGALVQPGAGAAGAALEPGAAVRLARPAHFRGLRQGERGRGRVQGWNRNRAARVRVSKGDKPVTYEEAHAPHHIAHRKGWLSLHTGNLDGEAHAAERTVEDVFLRKFMLGTFPGCLADQIILKRRANQVEICALVLRQLPAHKFYFLVGYSETLLSHFYKCPVRLHLQTVPSKVVYKYL